VSDGTGCHDVVASHERTSRPVHRIARRCRPGEEPRSSPPATEPDVKISLHPAPRQAALVADTTWRSQSLERSAPGSVSCATGSSPSSRGWPSHWAASTATACCGDSSKREVPPSGQKKKGAHTGREGEPRSRAPLRISEASSRLRSADACCCTPLIAQRVWSWLSRARAFVALPPVRGTPRSRDP
jgi:hypothetical protein